MLLTSGDRGDHVVFVHRNQDTNRDLTIIRPVGRLERATAPVEPDLAHDRPLQFGLDLRGVEESKI